MIFEKFLRFLFLFYGLWVDFAHIDIFCKNMLKDQYFMILVYLNHKTMKIAASKVRTKNATYVLWFLVVLEACKPIWFIWFM